MTPQLPTGFQFEVLQRMHRRRYFECGTEEVNQWLRASAWQAQKKHLSTTTVLANQTGTIAGFYTLSTGQVNFGDLPADLAKNLPRRLLPVAVLSWLGVDQSFQGQGLGELLFARALRDCHAAGQTFAFVAVIIDCLNEQAKQFYQRWDFQELPGHPMKLYLSTQLLENLMTEK